jgi:hypothetical protein
VRQYEIATTRADDKATPHWLTQRTVDLRAPQTSEQTNPGKEYWESADNPASRQQFQSATDEHFEPKSLLGLYCPGVARPTAENV